MRPTRSLAFLLLLALGVPVTAKVAAKSLPMVLANVSDEIRQPAASIDPRLEALKTVPIQRPAQGISKEESVRLRKAEARVWLAQSETLRAYRMGKTVMTSDAKEARQLEYVALLNAERAGNESRKQLRKALLQEMRADKSLPVAQRCEIVARDKYFELRKRQLNESRNRTSILALSNADAAAGSELHAPQLPSLDERLAAYASIERSLIQEFPGTPNGYEGLLNIARDSSQEQGAAIVAELLAIETIPENIKTQAEIIRARYALDGRSISELAADLPLTSGVETWLYTYSTNHPGSITLARMLAGGKPSTVELIGLCLDKPLDEGNPTDNQVPSRIIQDDGNLSVALVMTVPGLAYAINADGRIRTVNVPGELRASRRITGHGGM